MVSPGRVHPSRTTLQRGGLFRWGPREVALHSEKNEQSGAADVALKPPSPTPELDVSLTVGVLVLIAVVSFLAVVMIIRDRRHQRQMGALLERLAALDAARGVSPALMMLPSDRAPLEGEGGSTAVSGGSSPPGDVLAGKTSHVRRVVEGAAASAATLADQAIVCVHRHLEENVAPGQIAAELYVSLRTLERGLAAELDCTPSQLILAMKMREARDLLRSDRFTVSEVAYRLAFSSPSHFSRRYKAFYGRAPSEEIRRQAA